MLFSQGNGPAIRKTKQKHIAHRKLMGPRLNTHIVHCTSYQHPETIYNKVVIN